MDTLSRTVSQSIRRPEWRVQNLWEEDAQVGSYTLTVGEKSLLKVRGKAYHELKYSSIQFGDLPIQNSQIYSMV